MDVTAKEIAEELLRDAYKRTNMQGEVDHQLSKDILIDCIDTLRMKLEYSCDSLFFIDIIKEIQKL